MYINPNNYMEMEDCYELTLIYKYQIYHTYFDKSLYDRLSVYHWRLSKKKNKMYACTGQNKNGNKIIYMSNLIMNFIPDKIQEVDHIDGDSLNNRKSNLRLIKRIDNIHNVKVRLDNKTTGIRGVSYSKQYNDYAVDFYYNNQRLYFKHFKLLEEAIYVRYLCEITLLQEYRYYSDDKNKIFLINKLDENKKHELEKYLNSKLKEKGLYS